MKCKILILNYGLHVSGVSWALINLANALENYGYEVTIKLAENDFTLVNHLHSSIKCSLFLKEWNWFGTRVRGFLRFYSYFMKFLRVLPLSWQYKLVVRERYDVEIAFNRGDAARIISGSTNNLAKKYVWVHSDYSKTHNPLAGFASLEEARKGYLKFDQIVCVSNQAKAAFEKKFDIHSNLTTRFNILDQIEIQENALREQVRKNRFTLVAVGRLCEAKNYRLLLDVVKELRRRSVDIDLWIVGDGELKQDLVQYRNDLGLNHVEFLGAKENPYPYFAAADLYVSSSIYEGLSTTTIEALILGKPIVVTDCTGMRDILGDSQWGVVVPIETMALADAIEKMVVDEKHRTYYTKQALIRAKDFEPEKCFRKIEELWS